MAKDTAIENGGGGGFECCDGNELTDEAAGGAGNGDEGRARWSKGKGIAVEEKGRSKLHSILSILCTRGINAILIFFPSYSHLIENVERGALASPSPPVSPITT